MRKRKGKNTGFTLFELVIVLAIISALTAISVANYRDFEKKVVLDNLALDVSLSIRLAQVYGLNVRGQSGNFNESYGIHFESTENMQYILFRDPDRGGASGSDFGYTGSNVEIYSISGGYSIADVCAVRTAASGGGTDCFSGAMTDFDIVFDRPRPDAIFSSNFAGVTYESATITLESPLGLQQNVSVLSTGYISVE